MVETVPSLIHLMLKKARLILMFMHFSSLLKKINSLGQQVKIQGYCEINKEV